MPLGDDVHLEEIAAQTRGYSGADLENLVRKAGLQAMRENIESKIIPMRFFDEALKDSSPSVTPEMDEEYKNIAKQLKQESPQNRRIEFTP
jgi:transitional endoplasmic reticulum ATPase